MKQVKYLSYNILTSVILALYLAATQVAHAQTENRATAQLPLADIRLFTDIYARIKQEYVEEVDDKALIEGAIRGMMSSLDPHSNYLSSDEFEELKIGTKGELSLIHI